MSDDVSIPNPAFRRRRAGQYSRGAASRRSTWDPDTKRLLLFAGGVAGVLLALIAASFLTNHHGGKTPVIYADTTPIRIKPENPGGLKIDAAESEVFSGGTDSKNARLGPAAEAPDTKALHATAEPASPPRSAPQAAAQAAAQATLPLSPPAPAAPAAPASRDGGIATASLVRPVLPPAPAAKSDTHAAEAAAAKSDAHPTAAGILLVQLAVMPTEAGAKEEWLRLSRRLPDLFSGHTAAITRTERDGRTIWRLRTTGFPDIAKARAFCEQVRAKGGSCSVSES